MRILNYHFSFLKHELKRPRRRDADLPRRLVAWIRLPLRVAKHEIEQSVHAFAVRWSQQEERVAFGPGEHALRMAERAEALLAVIRAHAGIAAAPERQVVLHGVHD